MILQALKTVVLSKSLLGRNILARPSLLQPAAIFSRNAITESKLAKDVILFKYDNPKFFKYLNAFALIQFVFWGFMGQFSVQSMRDVPVKENVDDNLPWWQKVNLGEGKYRNTLAFVCYFFGASILGFAWVFTLRSVRFLILNKGADKISLVTYSPAGENRILTVPLNKISCVQSREAAKSSLPLRVAGQKFYFLLDMRGEFKNPQLFDRTAGIMRKL